jgi:DNA-directed RNA polymerase subunit RPC12/RpoP
MSRREENTGFTCENCGRQVLPLSNGSYRNHCPHCLYSKHVDEKPGDRRKNCGGLMQPVGVTYKSGKGLQIIHRCLACGAEKVNKVAGDTSQPDDIEALAGLMQSLSE